MIVKGLNVPPELQRDFYNATEVRAQQDRVILARRRTHGGLITGKREKVNRAFLASVCCWHIQDDEQKKQWYQDSLGSGMRYYNYFMHKTIPPMYRGEIPAYCTIVDTGMMEIAGTWWDAGDYGFGVSVHEGDLLELEFQMTWAGWGEWEDPDWPGFPFPDSWQVQGMIAEYGWPAMELRMNMSAASGCGEWEIEEYGSPENRSVTKAMFGQFENYVPEMLRLQMVAPFGADDPSALSWVASISVDCSPGWQFGGGSPAAWLLHCGFKINGEYLYKYGVDDPPGEPGPPQLPGVQPIPHMNDPYSRYGHGFPVCGV